jgi:uncharacterized protein YycO
MGNQQRTVELALYRGKSLVSSIIKWISWGIYSHAAVRLPEENGRIYEAWEGVGVRKGKSISEGHTPNTRVDLFSMSVTTIQYIRIVSALESQVGKKYDFKGVFRFSPLLRLFVSHTPSHAEQDKWFCSELAEWSFEEAGKPLLNVPPWRASPSDLAGSPLIDLSGTIWT